MLTCKASRRAVKGLGFHKRGAVNMEYVFAGRLAAVILGALVLTVYFSFIRSPGTKVKPIEEVHLKCDQCGHEFVEKIEDIDPSILRGAEFGIVLDCPSCGEKETAFQMNKCPKCEKYYLAPAHRNPMAIANGAPGANVCSHCGTDITQWTIDQYKQKKKKKK